MHIYSPTVCKSDTGLVGLKPKHWHSRFLSGGRVCFLEGESVSWSFPALGGAHAPWLWSRPSSEQQCCVALTCFHSSRLGTTWITQEGLTLDLELHLQRLFFLLSKVTFTGFEWTYFWQPPFNSLPEYFLSASR